jgi:hypothetical protein
VFILKALVRSNRRRRPLPRKITSVTVESIGKLAY